MKTINILLIAILSIFIFACKTTSVAKSTRISDIQGVWNLQDNGETVLGIGNSPITLVFAPTSNGEINGFAGCNNYGANVNGDNGMISFSNIYNTRMACPNMEIENNYLQLLSEVNRYEKNRSNLYLYKDNLLLFHFKK